MHELLVDSIFVMFGGLDFSGQSVFIRVPAVLLILSAYSFICMKQTSCAKVSQEKRHGASLVLFCHVLSYR